MDQGVASVLGAGAAAVGVLATGWFTYRATRRGPRDQRDVELGRTLRDERRTVYDQFIEAAGQLDHALAEFDPRQSGYLRAERPSYPRPSSVSRSLDHLIAAETALGELKRRAELAGPDSVAKAADDAWRKVTLYREALSRSSQGQVSSAKRRKALGQLARRVEESRQQLAKKSRGALSTSR